MTKRACESCSQNVVVTDEQAKRYDAFVCYWCHKDAQLKIEAEMGPSATPYFATDEVNFNGRRCGIAHVRVA